MKKISVQIKRRTEAPVSVVGAANADVSVSPQPVTIVHGPPDMQTKLSVTPIVISKSNTADNTTTTQVILVEPVPVVTPSLAPTPISSTLPLKVTAKPIPPFKGTSICIETKHRQQAREILKRSLSSYFTEEELTSLECSIHARAVIKASLQGVLEMYNSKFLTIYNDILSNCVIHLNPSSYAKNTYLLNAVRSGDIPLDKVPSLSQQELFPKIWDKQTQYKRAETQQISIGPKVATSKLIRCGRCGGETTYTEVQSRSCDEAMTIKVQCQSCGNKFNM